MPKRPARQPVMTSPTHLLFPDAHIEEEVPATTAALVPGPFAGVALETSVDKVLDYAIPSRLVPLLRVGRRVTVPLGRNNRPPHGYVVSIHYETTYPRI